SGAGVQIERGTEHLAAVGMDPARAVCQHGPKGRAKANARLPRGPNPGQSRRPAQAGLRPERGDFRRRYGQSHSAIDQRAGFEPAAGQMIASPGLVDSYGRVLRDLRVSITDRCNFRCLYCLPETEAAHNFYRGRWANLPHSAPIAREWQPKSSLLTFEEIARVVRVAVGLGIQKVRLTGGEPLLRRDLEKLVARIAGIPGVTDLA